MSHCCAISCYFSHEKIAVWDAYHQIMKTHLQSKQIFNQWFCVTCVSDLHFNHYEDETEYKDTLPCNDHFDRVYHSQIKHNAYSSIELPDLHATQALTNELQVLLVREWQLGCLCKLPPSWHQTGNWRNPWMKDDTILIDIFPTDTRKCARDERIIGNPDVNRCCLPLTCSLSVHIYA